jgi:hypothetical protein
MVLVLHNFSFGSSRINARLVVKTTCPHQPVRAITPSRIIGSRFDGFVKIEELENGWIGFYLRKLPGTGCRGYLLKRSCFKDQLLDTISRQSACVKATAFSAIKNASPFLPERRWSDFL